MSVIFLGLWAGVIGLLFVALTCAAIDACRWREVTARTAVTAVGIVGVAWLATWLADPPPVAYAAAAACAALGGLLEWSQRRISVQTNPKEV